MVQGKRVHERVTDALRAAIDPTGRNPDGMWGPGDRLPGEHQLANQFKCGRNTIRTALDTLESEGLVERHAQRGTFVRQYQAVVRRLTTESPTFPGAVTIRDDWAGDIAASDYAGQQNVHASAEPGTTRVGAWALADLLALEADEQVYAYRLDRMIREAAGDRYAVWVVESTCDWYVPYDLATQTGLISAQLVDVPRELAVAGYRPVTCRMQQAPRMPHGPERERLDLLAGTAVLETTTIYRTITGRPVAVRHEIYPGNGVVLQWELPVEVAAPNQEVTP